MHFALLMRPLPCAPPLPIPTSASALPPARPMCPLPSPPAHAVPPPTAPASLCADTSLQVISSKLLMRSNQGNIVAVICAPPSADVCPQAVVTSPPPSHPSPLPPPMRHTSPVHAPSALPPRRSFAMSLLTLNKSCRLPHALEQSYELPEGQVIIDR